MFEKNSIKRQLVVGLAAVFLWVTLPAPTVQAGIVGTEASAQLAQHEAVKYKLNELLARQDVQKALIERGIDPAEAQARVDALTPSEARQFAGRLEQLPEGGTTVVGAIVFIFVLLLITDLLGLTDFYPFTR